jgi:hypothetical protein
MTVCLEIRPAESTPGQASAWRRLWARLLTEHPTPASKAEVGQADEARAHAHRGTEHEHTTDVP